MKSYTFRIIVEPEKSVGYHGFVPMLKGVHTYGRTIDEIRMNLQEAIRCHIHGLLKDKIAIPREEEALEMVQTFSERDFAVMH